MGVQIVIEYDDMVKAGWTPFKEIVHTCEYNFELGYDVPVIVEEYYWEKGTERVWSYTPPEWGFMWDCNSWGSNKPRFITLGLLDLPHRFV